MTREKNDMSSATKDLDESQSQELVVKRKAGGSITRYKPMFSDDSGSIYIIWEWSVREYNTRTGQLVRTLENTSKNPVVCLGLHPEKSSLIYACTNHGKLLSWSQETGLLEKCEQVLSGEYGKKKVTGFHFTKKEKQLYMVIENKEKKSYQFLPCTKKSSKGNRHPLSIDSHRGEHSFSFGGESHQEFLACINKKKLLIMDLGTKKIYKQTTGGDREFTCVASHKTEMCIATGDFSGRVLVWRDFTGSGQVPRSIYHWHTLPVADLAFSQAASHFYSGGSECVLVKWVLDTDSRVFLPRIGAPIKHIAVAADNRYVAVSTDDNAVLLVDPRTRITQTIQHMSSSFQARGEDQKVSCQAGLTMDPNSKALVVNSNAGHLQFYSTENQDLLFKLDIVGQNFVTRERHATIANTDVTCVAVSADGMWLGTIEERDDQESHLEVRLKFWKAHWLESFKLNTSVELPHQGSVLSLQFQPGLAENEPQKAITSGTDRRFCVWNLVNTPLEKDEEDLSSWACEGVGTHQNLQAGPVAFSSDGSLLAVGFEHALTLWVPDSTKLQSSLTHPEARDSLRHIQFGNAECCHLLVAASKHQLFVWDLLSLSLAWTVPLSVSCLAANPRNDHMAVFTTDSQMFVFKPSEEMPLHSQHLPEDCKAVSALFWPYAGRKPHKVFWQQLAQLFFINEHQELLGLELESEEKSVEDEEEVEVLPAGGDAQYHQTAFSALLAKQATSLVKEARPPPLWEQQLKTSKGSYTHMLCSTPAHMLPPMELIVKDLVREYLDGQSEDAEVAGPGETDEVMEVEESSSESESERRPRPPPPEAPVQPAKGEERKKEKALRKVLAEKMDWVHELLLNIKSAD